LIQYSEDLLREHKRNGLKPTPRFYRHIENPAPNPALPVEHANEEAGESFAYLATALTAAPKKPEPAQFAGQGMKLEYT
jgi:hypothetical protein